MLLPIIALDDMPPWCLNLMVPFMPICWETNAVAFGLYLFFIMVVIVTSGVALVRTFRKVEPEQLDHENELLRLWSKGVMSKSGGQLVVPPRSRLTAWLIVALWFGPFFRLAIIHQTLYPSEAQLEFFGFLVFGTLFLWLPVRWFSESLLMTSEGIRYRNLLMWGGIRPWQSFRHIELRDDGERGSQGIRLHSFWFWRNIVVNRNTIPNKEKFSLACRFIVARMIDQGVPIHVPVDGTEEWINACRG
ncbi:MAG: hypothetical protein H7832_00890 [Magnetococcus sp. DMHC-6]